MILVRVLLACKKIRLTTQEFLEILKTNLLMYAPLWGLSLPDLARRSEMVKHSVLLEAVHLRLISGYYDVIQHLYTKKFRTCEKSLRHILVLLTRTQTPAWVIVHRYECCGIT